MNHQIVKVLIVDSDDDAFLHLQVLLTEVVGETFEVIRAVSWQDGLSQLTTGSVDLAFVAERIGADTGIELIVAATSSGIDVPMILLSDDARDSGIDVREAGAIDFVVRRVLTPSLLWRSIKYAIGQAAAARSTRINDARFKAMYDHSSSIIAIADPAGRVLHINRAVETIVGVLPEDLIGTLGVERAHPDDLPYLIEAMGDVATEPGATATYTYRFRHADMSWRWFEATVTNLLHDPAIRGLFSTVHDVTDRVVAEAQLREQAARLQLLTELSSAFSASTLDLDTMLETLARRVSEMLNDICVLRLVSPDGLSLVPVAIWHPDLDMRDLLLRTHIGTHGIHEMLPGVVMRSGNALLIPEFDSQKELRQNPEKWTFFRKHDVHSMLIVPLRVRGEIIGTLALARTTSDHPYTDDDRDFLQDLADRAAQSVDNTRLYRRAVETEAQHRQLIEQLPAIIFVEALDGAQGNGAGSTLYMSSQVEQIFGMTSDEWMRQREPWINIVHPDDRARLLSEINRTNETGDPLGVQYRAIRPDGTELTVDCEARLVRDEDGHPRFWQGFIIDVTERQAVEAALREAEDKFRTLVEHIPAATFTISLTGEYLYVSPQIERLLGYPMERWNDGRAFWTSIVHPEDVSLVVAEDARTDETGDSFDLEYRYLAADGRVVWVRNQTELVRGQNGEPRFWQGYMIDITERKLAEQLLRDAEDKYRTLVEHNPAVIFTGAVDKTSTPTYMSPRFEQLLGYSADVWSSGSYWQTTVHPDDLDWVVALDKQTDATFEPFDAEYRAIAADGRVVWVHSNIAAIRDDHGVPLFWQGYMIDITERKQAEQRLREAQDQYRLLVEHSPAVIFTSAVDDASTPLYMSPQIERVLGYPPGAWSGSDIWDEIIHPDDVERVRLLDVQTGQTLDPFDSEFRVFAKDGRLVWLRNYSVAVCDESGAPQYWQGYLIDITAQKQAEEAIRFQAQLLEAVGQAVVATNTDGCITYWNHAAEILFCWTGSETVGLNVLDVTTPLVTYDISLAIMQQLSAGEKWEGELLLQRRDGSLFPAYVTHSPVIDDDGTVIGSIGVTVNISERKRLEQQLIHQAFHDALTGLPNRNLFLDRTRHALTLARRLDQCVAVLFLDLDNFKIVNDSLGHDIGDQLLVMTAKRIQSCLREGDTAARLGGDEFAVLLENLESARDAEGVASRLLEALRRPLNLEGHEMFVTPSIGIAVGDTGDVLAENLLRDADVAMYIAKRNGRARYEIFEPTMGSMARQRLELEHDLRRALDHDELSLCYQPIVSLSDGALSGFEALLRWDHPIRGQVAPSVFVPVAEESGLIVPVGSWVLRKACQQLWAWQDEFPSAQQISISVNLSGRQFKEPGLAREVAEILAEFGLAPRCLNLEITETIMMEDGEGTSAVLREFEQLGVTLAIDDFGTGYSSLGALRHFPVNTLKIDRSFVDGLGAESDDSVIVSGVVGLAHGLGLCVVAEGVETIDQLERLRELGCDLGQGYYFSWPLPADEVEQFLIDSRIWDVGREHPPVPRMRQSKHGVRSGMAFDDGTA